MSRVIWHNGKFIPESEAKMSIFDSGAMFSDVIFEMTRSFNKIQFKLNEHLDRLYNGIKILRMPIRYTKKELEKYVYETIEANEPYFKEDDEHRIMINVTRGLLSIYQEIGDPSPNIFIADFPLRWTVMGMGKLFDVGINAVIPTQHSISFDLLDPRIKNRSRLHYQMANIEVSNYKGENNWALLTDKDGFITEGTGDNFFIIKGNKIISPRGINILRGISLNFIKEKICKNLYTSLVDKMEFIEQDITPYDVYTADEAGMCATPFCILPVVSLNSIPIGDGKPGKKINCLLDEWSRIVGVDIKKQIQDWDKKNTTELNGSSPYQFKK